MSTSPPNSAEGPLEAIRAELHRRDVALVDVLLVRSGSRPRPHRDAAAVDAHPCLDAPPEDACAAHVAPVWHALCMAYHQTVRPALRLADEEDPAADRVALLALWQRIILGAHVADVKFAATPAHFLPAILRGDRDALDRAITHPEVEARVVQRAVQSAETLLGKDAPDRGTPQLTGLATIFRDVVIPFTKRVQIDTLLTKRQTGAVR